MADIRRPNITSPTVEGQVREIKNYLYQLVNQLNFVIRSVDSAAVDNRTVSGDPEQLFLSIKDSILTSAEIINVYSREIGKRLSGKYADSNDFRSFKVETDEHLTALDEQLSDIEIPQITVDDELNGDSGNPVANKAVTAALGEKSEIGHQHRTSEFICDNGGYWWGESGTVEDALMDISNSFASVASHSHSAGDIGFGYAGVSVNTVEEALIYLLDKVGA